MTSNTAMPQIEIVDFPETKVAVLEHKGDPKTIGDSVRKFIDWRKQNGLSPRVSDTYNIFYNNPFEVAPDDYRLDICVSVQQEVCKSDIGIVEKTIPSGRCAKLRHIGSDEKLGLFLHYLYSEWLPGSSEELRDFPLYLQRVKFFPDVAENEAITDVFLPIK